MMSDIITDILLLILAVCVLYAAVHMNIFCFRQIKKVRAENKKPYFALLYIAVWIFAAVSPLIAFVKIIELFAGTYKNLFPIMMMLVNGMAAFAVYSIFPTKEEREQHSYKILIPKRIMSWLWLETLWIFFIYIWLDFFRTSGFAGFGVFIDLIWSILTPNVPAIGWALAVGIVYSKCNHTVPKAPALQAETSRGKPGEKMSDEEV